MAAGRGLFVGVVLAFLMVVARAAPQAPLPDQQADIKVITITQSPAQAIEDAIRYDADVGAALESNDTQLYLLKSVAYTSGTAEDLGLPKEELLPDGAPDRIQVADKIVYSSSPNGTSSNQEIGSLQEQPSSDIKATLQLVPVPIN